MRISDWISDVCSSDLGLNNSVFTNDADRAYSVARQLRSGTVGHNNFRTDFGIAFGGFKQSGIGREGGVGGLLPYLESKRVLLGGRTSHMPAKTIGDKKGAWRNVWTSSTKARGDRKEE